MRPDVRRRDPNLLSALADALESIGETGMARTVRSIVERRTVVARAA